MFSLFPLEEMVDSMEGGLRGGECHLRMRADRSWNGSREEIVSWLG